MKRFSILKWFKNISIAKKLYFATGIMALLIIFELFTLWFSINTLSSVRAFVGGEGLWSKSQKDAVYNLCKYALSKDEKDYIEFKYFLKVPLGDRKARIEMAKADPDFQIIHEGFIEGHNSPEDINGMISLFREFHNIYYIHEAISIWTKADSMMLQLQNAADGLHAIVTTTDAASPENIKIGLREINEINEKITVLEDSFSSTLGEGSRWLENLILKLLLFTALTVEVSGLLLTISVSRNISKGINEIIRVSVKVAGGNFKEKATVYSKDEIGQLASSFNKMTDDLQKNRDQLLLAENEQVIYEKKLVNKEQQLEEAQRIAHIGSWEWNLIDNILTWSDELFRIHGMEPQEGVITIDKTEQWIIPEDMQTIHKQLKDNFENAKQIFKKGEREYSTPGMTYRIKRKDGNERILLGQGKITLNDKGVPMQMVGTVQDVTILKMAEKELRKTNAELEERVLERTKEMELTIEKLREEIAKREKSEAEIKKLSVVIGKTDNAVLITTKTGKIQWANEGFVRLSGYLQEEVIGTYGEILRHGKQTGLVPTNPFFSKMLSEKQSVTYESRNFKKDGTEYWAVSTLTPILDNAGEVESVVVIDSDITYRKKTEQELIKAKKETEETAKAKELFLANMSHEIRTPMNAIMGLIQLMQDTKLNEEQKEYLRTINFAGENLMYIINDVLDLAKIESGKMNIEKIEFNVNELAHDLVNSMHYRAKEKNIALLSEIISPVPDSLIGDPVRVNQILMNLLSNAIKFTEGGHVKLLISEVDRQNNIVKLRFSVEDTGIGINKNMQKLIFQAFEQENKETARKFGGTGLGLSIVKRLTELQNGEIFLQSEVGKGSVFSVELPFLISSKIKKDKLKKAKGEDPEMIGKEVLLVEDNVLNQMVAEKFLQGYGLNVSVAENGIEAIELLKNKKYDIVLMDIQMPQMDGYQATKYIREKIDTDQNKVLILAMTAHAIQGEEQKCLAAGMNGYISKPINREVLRNKIELMLNHKE